MLKFSRKNRLEQVAEIDVTTFMNLMVILVPFLLVTAVFSRMTVLQLQLPSKDAESGAAAPVDIQLQLELTPQAWILRSNDTDEITRLNAPQNVSEWRRFEEALVEIKSRFPTEKAITLFFDRQVPYKSMLEVMDHVRQTQIVTGTQAQWVELFPEIALGRHEPAEQTAAPAEQPSAEQAPADQPPARAAGEAQP
ncbi:MAG TPA: biopolymer transporter ExbD [Cellvibrionaceae bacterium]|nr:biopolymer transporter ExbD [Cellvibrionaceae bacterium]